MLRQVVLLSLLLDLAYCEYGGTLRLINVVWRHGMRAPVDTYPKDPHLNYSFPPFGWGQLTKEGRKEQYRLGKFLQSRYESFLGNEFVNDLVHVQSTDVDRAIMSGQLVLAGLFPPTDVQRWHDSLDWQPVPVHTDPLKEDALLLVRIPCPRYYELLDSLKKSEEVKAYLNTLQGLYQSLSLHTGLTIKDPDDVQSLYNTMLSEVLFNLTLPDWTRPHFPEEMASVTAYSFILNVYNDELKKLKGGPLLKKILKDVQTKAENPNIRRQMFMYAGHDSTVANFLMALKVWDQQIPTYNIMALVELHLENSVYGLKIFLKNSTGMPTQLRIPNCELFCPLDKVFELTQSVVPGDLQFECLSHNPNFTLPVASEP